MGLGLMTQAMSQKCIGSRGRLNHLKSVFIAFGQIHLVAVFTRVALALPTNAVAAVVAQGGRCVVWPA